jgi:hypothetical protein
VAGAEKIPLEPGRYCWHITEATQYRGLRRAAHEGCHMIGDMVSGFLSVPVGMVLLALEVPLVVLLLPYRLCFLIGTLVV